MKISTYLTVLFVALALVLGAYGLFHYLHILELPLALFKLMLFLIPVLFVVGAVIMIPGFKKGPENFVGRFMILTTFQMLAVLSTIAAVWYVRKSNLRDFGFQLIVLFILLMVVQSVLLIRGNRNR